MKATLDYAIIRSLCNELSPEDLPPEISHEAAAVIASPEPIPDERSSILHALEKTGGNRSEAARLFGYRTRPFLSPI